MDLDGIRARLPSMTREIFGDAVTVLPMAEGKMSAAVADLTREIQAGVKGRFDFSPDIEQMGGGRERPEAAHVISSHTSVSFAVADLVSLPRQGDHILRVDPHTATTERYRVDRAYQPVTGVLLCFLSRLS